MGNQTDTLTASTPDFQKIGVVPKQLSHGGTCIREMSDMDRTQYTDYRTLTTAGWQIDKSNRYNGGSETARHAVCKILVGHYLSHQLGYKVVFEVENNHGELDVLGYGNEDRLSPIGVECETNLTGETKALKLDQYYDNEPLQELYFLEVNDMPSEIIPAYERVAEQI
jgi:hypothetical protein